MKKLLRTFMLAVLFLPFALQAQTDCSSLSIPYAENFDAYTGNATSTTAPTGYPAITLPDCWSFLNMSETSGTYPQAFLTSSSTYAVSGNCLFFKSSSTTPLYAIMPSVGAQSGAWQLSFQYRNEGTTASNGTIIVGIMTDATDTTTFVALETLVRTTTKTLVELTIPAGTITDGARLAFCYQGGTSNNYYAAIDNVTLDMAPTCLKVTNLAIDATLTTANSLTLTWTDALNTGATYNIYDMSDTSIIESGVSGTTYTAMNLDANTAYTFGIETNCGGGDISNGYVVISGRTACAAQSLPWTCGFEEDEIVSTTSLTALPWCSERYTSAYTATTHYPYSYSSTTYAHSGSHVLYFYGGTGTTYPDTMALILPEIDVNTYPMNANRMTFWARSSSTSYDKTLYVYTLSNATDINSATLIDSVVVTGTTHVKYSVSLANAPATDAYVVLMVTKDNGYLILDDLTIEEMPSCLEISNLTVAEATANSLTISWNDTQNPDGTTYTVYNMADTSDVNPTFNGNVAVIENLNPNTLYTFGVQANCASGDAPIMTVSGRTSCAPEALPFSETFDASLAVNPCWGGSTSTLFTDSVALTNGSIGWTYTSTVRDGLPAGHYYKNVYGTSTKSWMIIPEIDLTNATSPLLSFDAAFTKWNAATPAEGNIDDDRFLVIVSTDGQNWYSANATNISLTSLIGTSYLTQYVDLSNYIGETIRIAFYCESTVTGGDNDLHIDNILIEEGTGEICYPVTNLAVSNITTNEATLTWNGEAASYNVYAITATDTTLEAANVSETSINLTGLNASTHYIYGVTSVCTSSESPMMTVAFNTACAPIELPYTETFDETSATRNCWDLVSNNTANVGGTNGMDFVTVNNREVLRFSSYSTASDYNQYGYSPLLVASSSATALNVNIVYATYGANDKLNFGYVTATDTVWDATQYTTTGNSNWQTVNFVIPANATQFAIHYYGNYSYYAWIDSVEITELTSSYCYPVTNLAVESTTASSVTLSWSDDNNSGATYTIYDMADSSVVATGVTGTSYEVTGLDALTGYTFGVAANCSATDASDVVTVSATTACSGGHCNITIVGVDSWGDGWNGNAINVMQGGVVIYTFTLPTSTSTLTETISICSDSPVSFSWVTGSYASEASFEILDGGNTSVYTCADGSTLSDGAVFYTMTDACPSCLPANALTVDNTTETSVTISWTGTAASYDLYNGTTFVANVTTNTYTFTGLTPGTTFTFGVQAICSADDSAALATINVMTDCADVTSLPYFEGFENGLGCWSTVNGSADGMPWYAINATTIPAHSGDAMAISFSYYNGNPIHANSWLISPKFVLPTTTDSLTLTWWHRVSSYYPTELYDVLISTTTNDTAAFTTTLLAVSPDSTNEYMQNIVDLTPYAGQPIYLAFHHHDSYDQNYLVIDDIEIFQGGYVPPAPDTLTVTFAVNDPIMGTTTPAPGTYQYLSGDTIYFAASANIGYHFSGWQFASGNIIDTISATYISAYASANAWMTYGNITLTALFEAGNPDSTTITYAVNDPTMGTLTPAPGTYTIYVGNNIIVEATPNAGYTLSAWVFDTYLSGTLYNSDTILSTHPSFNNPMNFGTLPQSYADYNATITITALFEGGSIPVEDSLIIHLTINNPNLGSISPAPGDYTLALNDTVLLIATPNAGEEFSAWRFYIPGQPTDLPMNPFQFVINENFLAFGEMTIEARFVDTTSAPDSLTMIVNTADPTMGTTNPAPGTYSYAVGEHVTLSAVPNPGYEFLYWIESATFAGTTLYDTIAIQTLSMDIPQMYANWTLSITAYFEPVQVLPCETPTGVEITSFNAESISLEWNNDVNVESWNVRYRVQGTEAWTPEVAYTNSYTINNLNPLTTYEIQVQANCGAGNTSEWTATVVETTPDGIINFLESNVSLYPNPAKDYVDVRIDGDVNVTLMEVFDVYGKLINTVNVIDNLTRINVNGLANGMYFVRVTTDNGVVTKSFVKK